MNLTNSELKQRLIDTTALLSIPGIGRGRYSRLVKEFGSASAALGASISQLENIKGMSRKLGSAVKSEYDGEKARTIAARIIQLGWAVLFPDSDEYPRRLVEIDDPPPILFRDGDPEAKNEKALAIVGTRHPSEQAKLFANQMARSLAESGVTVVSGMAEGIDSAVHTGALDGGGKTVAVWGTSLDIVYPKTNKTLAEKIRRHGAVYSEYFPGTAPDRAFFPARNRLISGMSEGVVVVEAGQKSGALITASHALDHGRELFAVPGPPMAKNSQGCHRLIKQGARLTTSTDDIFDELPILKGGVIVKKFTQLPDMTDTERRIIRLFECGPQQIDKISRDTDMTVTELSEFLLALELKGVLKELSGKRFMLSEDYK